MNPVLPSMVPVSCGKSRAAFWDRSTFVTAKFQEVGLVELPEPTVI